MSSKTKDNLFKRLITISLAISLVFSAYLIVEASPSPSVVQTPGENEYIEFKATEINDIEGQGKQVIIELWGHDIELVKRF